MLAGLPSKLHQSLTTYCVASPFSIMDPSRATRDAAAGRVVSTFIAYLIRFLPQHILCESDQQPRLGQNSAYPGCHGDNFAVCYLVEGLGDVSFCGKLRCPDLSEVRTR